MTHHDPAARDASSWLADTRTSYDTDAVGYAEKVQGILETFPHLRAQLDVFAELIRCAGGGPVADVGCGTGYATRYLHDSGIEAFGIDLSPKLVAIAQRDHPDLRFEVGSMTNLDMDAHSAAGIVAFWSTIHIPDYAMSGVIAELHRVLRPEGLVLVGFHVGDGIEHAATGYTKQPINIDTHLRQPSTMSNRLHDAGFRIESTSVFRPDDVVPGAIIVARKRG
ncbi:class I SAM-dependent methyltransferase [Haloglycomyces albus]|uniref:class I SAM-dependent methyltransferase n=1 Tax=Haloglycomyces albus TaxID=526067 RepID=UPI00046D1F13|nr:class I SAM-dependent methyltransferase [Haloglycomyces albus]